MIKRYLFLVAVISLILLMPELSRAGLSRSNVVLNASQGFGNVRLGDGISKVIAATEWGKPDEFLKLELDDGELEYHLIYRERGVKFVFIKSDNCLSGSLEKIFIYSPNFIVKDTFIGVGEISEVLKRAILDNPNDDLRRCSDPAEQSDKVTVFECPSGINFYSKGSPGVIEAIEIFQAAPNVARFENRSYNLVARHSGYCLAIVDDSITGKPSVQQFDCGGEGKQLFKIVQECRTEYYTIKSEDDSKCFDIRKGSKKKRANVQPWECNSKDHQLFKFVPSQIEGYYSIVAKHSNRCLDIPSESKREGTNLQQWDCNGKVNQLWRVEPK